MKGKIYRHAEICSVADAYDNPVMNPNNDKQLTPAEAFRGLIVKSGTVYNKHIFNTLISIVPHSPVGSYVRIKEIIDPILMGYCGVVTRINENNLNKPIIILLHDRSKKRIKPKKIDTSKLRHVDLDLIL
ncbi:hypothetical protein ACFL47_05360 [Candidatus Latescibacterota bacterium]